MKIVSKHISPHRDCVDRSEDQQRRMTIRDRIESMADRQGEAVFLLSPETNRRTTYRQLAQRANNFCRKLLTQGLTPGDKVASLLDNSLFAAEWLLGTMYGGFVPVPLNPCLSAGDLIRLLEHSEAKIFFVAREHLDSVRQCIPAHMPIEVVEVDEAIGQDGVSEACLPELVRGEDDALMAYTSGSTGHPKGVVVSHRNLIEGGQNTINAHQLTEQDRSLCVLPLYHMNAQVITLIATLLSGGSVVAPRQFKAGRFWSWVGDYRCTWFALVPSLISQLVQTPNTHHLREQCIRVRFARSSSAPLPPSLLQAFETRFDLPLIEAMGMTEAGGAVFSNPLPPAHRKAGSPGRPWGFDCRIVDPEGSDIPNGSTGEILVRGPSVMKGYFKDQPATAEILDSDGWLRTGDLGCKDDDGFVFIRGRSKEMINRGGEKIVPREIDEMLARHPAVHEAVAIGVPDFALGEDLMACVVLKDDIGCTEDDLLEFCRSGLGLLKTPSRIHFVDDLPRGPTGKVQRLKLADRFSTSSAGTFSSTVSAAKGSPFRQHEVKRTLIDLWSVFLKCERVQAEDNFFALGGNSLLAIRMLSRLRQCFGVELPLSFFFEYPTVVRQADIITRMDQQSPALIERSFSSSGRKKVFSLSTAQQHLLVIQRMYPDSLAFNEAEAFHLEGPVDIVALEQTFEAIIARHEMLRTTIDYVSDAPVQVVHPHLAWQLLQHDLSHVPQGEREEALRSTLTTHMRQTFNLDQQLLRVALIKLTADEQVLFLMLNHLVCDGWSMGILHRELTQCYLAFKTKNPPALIALRCQYSTFVEHERTRLSDANAIGPDIAFWKDTLGDAPELLTLPTDRPRPAVFSHRGARVPVRIDRNLSQRMRQTAQQEQVSLFTLVAAAFNTFLFRYSGQPDIVLGIPIAHRDQPEFMSLIGVLIDTVVLRSNLSGDPLFSQVLTKTRIAITQALRHRAVPFDQLIEGKNLTRALDRSPLFQVLLNWRDPEAQTDLLSLDGLRVRPMEVDRLTAKFDLTLSLTDTGNEISGHMEFSTDLWNRSSICRMLDHYNSLLKDIVANPHRPISEFPLLTETDRHRLLSEWNNTVVNYPRFTCIHELFEEQVERTPDAVAIIFNDQQLTYRVLNERANQLAYYLQAREVGPEARVGLCVEPSLDQMVGLLGILKAGGAYVPLDPAYPTDRLEFILQDMAIQVLVTHSALTHRLPNTGQVLCLDEDQEFLKENAARNPVNRTQAGNLAYVMYTSGSTGQPKGVCVEHRAVIRLVRGTSYATFSSEEVYWHLAPLAFDASTFEIWGALLNGARLVMLPQRQLMCDEIGGTIRQYQVTTLWLTAALFHVMVGERIEALKPLRHLLAGGDKLSVPHVEKARRELSDCRLVNGYGPTEGTTFSCCYPVPLDGSLGNTVPIGRPIGNTTTYILDAHRQPVPISVRGELYIGGEGLARGYWNRPELTAEKFIPHPFDRQPGARLYTTGDWARYRPDGNIEFLGRRDHQVKIRGYRIELGEIEAILEQQELVSQAIVLIRETALGDKQLVAYVIPAKAESPSSKRLREALAVKLPDYMVPSLYVFLDAFPLTPNGKVNRRGLPPPWQTDRVQFTTDESPRTSLENLLVTLWTDLLNIGQIGVDDNFFVLGGHSLLATRVVTRLRTMLEIDIPVRTLFEHPTVAELAKAIDSQLGTTFPDWPKNDSPLS